jgi:hypothetical protein
MGLENRDYGRGDPLRWPRDTLYQLKLALTSPTGCGRSVGIVRLRTKTTEFFIVIDLFIGNDREMNNYTTVVALTAPQTSMLPWQQFHCDRETVFSTLSVPKCYAGPVSCLEFMRQGIADRTSRAWRRIRITSIVALQVVKGDGKGTQCLGV